jgi:hypothetical protein
VVVTGGLELEHGWFVPLFNQEVLWKRRFIGEPSNVRNQGGFNDAKVTRHVPNPTLENFGGFEEV